MARLNVVKRRARALEVMVNKALRGPGIRECDGGVGTDVDLRLAVFEINRAISSGLYLGRQSEMSRITDSYKMTTLGYIYAAAARNHHNRGCVCTCT